MQQVVAVLALVAFLAAWQWFLYKRTGGRVWSPLWNAFSATAAAILFLVAGALGYQLTNGVPFTVRTAWSGKVIWSEIWIGTAAAVLAVFLWRLGLRSLRGAR